MTRIAIHEDEEGMRNLYPAAASDHAMSDLALAQKTSKGNRVDPRGWSDMHVISEPKSGYRDLDIPAQAMEDIVGRFLPRIHEFEIGAGAGEPFHSVELDALCFGFTPNSYLKLEADAGRLTAIWFDDVTGDPA